MRRLKYFFIVAILGVFVHSSNGYGATFDIYPVKIFFDSKNRIEKLTIKNLAEKTLNLQIRVFSWTQDGNGMDVYEDTKDILLFPKTLSLKPDEEKIVRVGSQIPSSDREKTYRIIVEELPPLTSEQKEGSVVHILLRISIPIFVASREKKLEAKIELRGIENGNLLFDVLNTGNTHFIAEKILIKGVDEGSNEVFSTSQNGWYILSNMRRTFSVPIEKEVVHTLKRLHIFLKGNDGFEVQRVFSLGEN